MTSDALFRSGMAARLAGLPVGTLRVWERRYGLGGARTTGAGHRRYTREDVSRLALLKRLVDAGHAIGEIAALPLEQLAGLVPPDAAQPRVAAAGQATRVVVIGEAIEAAAGHRSESLQVVARCSDPAHAARELQDTRADVVVVGLPTLPEDAAARVDSLRDLVGARGAIVAYRFGTRGRIETLRGRGHVVARAPLSLDQLEVLAARLPASHADVQWPAPRLHPVRFDEAALARLAQGAASLACECPRHLVELLRDLGAFERYSAECAHRSPRDADLHHELQRVTSTARAMLEDALARVAAEEGIAAG